MSLYANLHVNSTPIGNVTVSRQEHLQDGQDEYTYSYRATNDRGENFSGTLKHRYSEGAYELLAKVFIHLSHEQNGWD